MAIVPPPFFSNRDFTVWLMAPLTVNVLPDDTKTAPPPSPNESFCDATAGFVTASVPP